MERIIFKNNILIIYFVSNQKSPYYSSETFGNILKWVQNNHKIAHFEQKNDKLSLTAKPVKGLKEVKDIIIKIL
jgi:transcription-repair coupling factor (superfamily II helicase)